MFNGVAMCCGDVMFNAMGTVLDFELLSQCSMIGHVLWRCSCSNMGTHVGF